MEMIIRHSVWCSVFCLAAEFVAVGTNAAAEDKRTNEAMAGLIEQLVLTERDTSLMDGRSYLSREAATRINAAFGQLKNASKDAWPQLFAHLQDKRNSTPSADTNGPYDVGQKCYFILRSQILDMPAGYPYSKLLAYNRISFRPRLDVWLTQRQSCSLDEIRCEVLRILIDMESYANQAEAVALLEPHLAKIEERIQLAAQGQQRPLAVPR
jgi:hypothetical protein